MKKEFTINYFKQWDKDGTCYSQTINISTQTLNEMKGKLQTEVFKPKYHKGYMAGDLYYSWLYLKESFGAIENGLVFMNLTQRDFFNKYLKLKLKNRNTCFAIM